MDMMKKVPVTRSALAIIKKRLRLRHSAALTARIPDAYRDVP